jgi:HSP20 family protein
MNNMTRRESFENPLLSRFFSTMLNDPFFAEAQPMRAFVEEGTLPLDISEDDSSVIVRASLPGFSKEDVEIEVHDGVLSIKAQHTEEKEEKGERFYRKERRFGSVSRRVALPTTVVEDRSKADLKDGVLTLRLAKVPAEQPKKIRIE